ncbi:bifunctional riboflavin kinase/FAD synthetase [bacterium]|nr:bifunctional riboflavin kinase/FAD synthetase [bacterium]
MPDRVDPLTNIITFDNLQPHSYNSSCITVGNFDGVHRGHQAIIGDIVAAGKEKGKPVLVITFFPNPVEFFSGSKRPVYLTTPAEKEAILLQLGVDKVITFRFDRKFADLMPETFLSALKEKLGLGTLVVGYDFAMGKDRQGTIPVIRALGKEMGFSVEVMDAIEFEGEEISSTRIRQALDAGDVRLPQTMLGRPYTVSGEVAHGSDRGTRIGIPTANLAHWPLKMLPAVGVYATRATVLGNTYQGVTNVGYRPTFEDQEKPNIETHILDFDGNIYGEKFKLQFVEKIRDEQKFDGVDALIAQIERDKATARRIFNHDET